MKFVLLFCWIWVLSDGKPVNEPELPHSREFYAGYIKAITDNFDQLFENDRETRSTKDEVPDKASIDIGEKSEREVISNIKRNPIDGDDKIIQKRDSVPSYNKDKTNTGISTTGIDQAEKRNDIVTSETVSGSELSSEESNIDNVYTQNSDSVASVEERVSNNKRGKTSKKSEALKTSVDNNYDDGSDNDDDDNAVEARSNTQNDERKEEIESENENEEDNISQRRYSVLNPIQESIFPSPIAFGFSPFFAMNPTGFTYSPYETRAFLLPASSRGLLMPVRGDVREKILKRDAKTKSNAENEHNCDDCCSCCCNTSCHHCHHEPCDCHCCCHDNYWQDGCNYCHHDCCHHDCHHDPCCCHHHVHHCQPCQHNLHQHHCCHHHHTTHCFPDRCRNSHRCSHHHDDPYCCHETHCHEPCYHVHTHTCHHHPCHVEHRHCGCGAIHVYPGHPGGYGDHGGTGYLIRAQSVTNLE